MYTTVSKRPALTPNTKYLYEFRGVAADAKPTDSDKKMATGSTFYEIDTQDIYMYDASTSTWIKQ